MTGPTVSVIVPVYNAVDGLRAALDSVLAQTWTDFEVLVVDDGSEPGTGVAAHLPDDPRIRLLTHDRNAGYAAVTNTAIARARGEWVTFVDGDDTVRPDYLAAQLELGERTGADVVFAPIATRDTRGVRSTLAYRPGTALTDGLTALRLVLTGAVVASQHLLLRRSALTSGAPAGNAYSDIVFLCRNLVTADAVAFADRPLYDYAIHSGSVSGALRTSIWDLTALPGALDATLRAHCPDPERVELVACARNLVVAQMLNKAALEPRDTPLRRSVTRWARSASGPRSVLTAARAGDWRAALSLAAVLPGGRFHRLSHRVYEGAKRLRA